jgi:hypothetical protein
VDARNSSKLQAAVARQVKVRGLLSHLAQRLANERYDESDEE